MINDKQKQSYIIFLIKISFIEHYFNISHQNKIVGYIKIYFTLPTFIISNISYSDD